MLISCVYYALVDFNCSKNCIFDLQAGIGIVFNSSWSMVPLSSFPPFDIPIKRESLLKMMVYFVVIILPFCSTIGLSFSSDVFFNSCRTPCGKLRAVKL